MVTFRLRQPSLALPDPRAQGRADLPRIMDQGKSAPICFGHERTLGDVLLEQDEQWSTGKRSLDMTA
jgi:hypothetical protein